MKKNKRKFSFSYEGRYFLNNTKICDSYEDCEKHRRVENEQ